jgi:hypothetical protein
MWHTWHDLLQTAGSWMHQLLLKGLASRHKMVWTATSALTGQGLSVVPAAPPVSSPPTPAP